MSYLLSVDLGTTFSAAAVRDGDRVEVFQLGSRAATIPSVVALRGDGEMLVGEAADRRGFTEPTRVAREFKRRLGDPTPIILGGTPYGAETLMAGLLREIVGEVTRSQDSSPERVILSHPANYGPYKLDLMEHVGQIAELTDIVLIPEPQAAAVHYVGLERVELGEVVAVYDLGGGTFDVALVRRTEDGFDLIGEPEGLERFGGIDLDEAVFEHVKRSLGEAAQRLDTTDPAVTFALARLRDDCRSAKETLSSDTETEIPVMLPGLHTEVRLTRSEFEDMIRPRLRETVSLLERVVSSAGLDLGDVSKVLLVGGSSHIPLVGETVRGQTGRPIAHTANPKHAMALGAVAAIKPIAKRPTVQPDDQHEEEEDEPTPVALTEAAESGKPVLDTGPVEAFEAETAVDESPEVVFVSEQPEEEEQRPAQTRRLLVPGLVMLIVAVATAATLLLTQNGDPGENGPETGLAEGPVAEIVVPVRIATTSDAAALTLVSGASWSARGPIDVSGPNVDGAAEADAILIGRLPDEPPGTWIESLFEVTFSDVDQTLTFALDRSDPSSTAEFNFPSNPSGPTFVAEGETNPVEFEVAREDLSG